MENRKKLQKYFKKQYYNKNANYKAILSKIRKEEYMNKNKIFKIISTAILTLLGTTSIAFAGTKIYNEYIKVQNNIQTTKIWDNGTGITSYDTDLTQNDMIYCESSNLYHKVITNMDDYNRYKSRINELPEMSENSFNENFLVVVVSKNYMELHNRDLAIKDVFADETTTHIILRQNENPNYDNDCNVWYAVIDNSQLRNEIETKIEYEYIKNPQFVSLKDLSNKYSIEDALKDGCFVEEKNEVLSDNKYFIDEFIKKTENGENAFIRIYSKYNDTVRIVDLEYKDKIFILNWKNLDEDDINVHVYKYVMKGNKKDNNLVRYYLTNDSEGYGDGDWKGVPFASIYQE